MFILISFSLNCFICCLYVVNLRPFDAVNIKSNDHFLNALTYSGSI